MLVKLVKNYLGLCLAGLLALLLSACDSDKNCESDTIEDRVLNISVTATGTTIGVGNMKTVDLNNDSLPDLEMTAFYSYFAGKSFKGINGTLLFVASDTAVFFAPNQSIGNTATPAIDNTVYSDAIQSGYVGFRLTLADGPHYGWYRTTGKFADASPFVSVTATINSMAFERTPEASIPAGKQ